jgi:transposase
MDAITDEQLVDIERRIVARMVEEFALDVSGLVLDMTNFATYIDSANDRAPIAQRGKAKQKRNDLRLVGLGLVISTDGGIPLVSHAYAGNRHDSSQFPDVINELVQRFGAIAPGGAGLTVVFDAGQDSEDNLALIDSGPLHFVGSLPPSDHLDLMALPKSRYKKVDAKRFPGLSAFETTKVVFGRQRRIVVTHSQNFHDEQAAGFEQTLAKARRQLSDLAARLARGGGRKSREKVEAEIAGIVRPRWLNRVISVNLTGTKPSELRITWRTTPAAKAALADELFGKRIIFTDRDQWSIADVVAGYRSQSEVEADFRQMKDRLVVSFSPMFHWTEQKIRVHVFYCVLALMVARLMARETERAKIPMSVRELLSHLSRIEETVLLYQGERGRPRARRMLTEMDPMQVRLYDLFGLNEYAPTR